MMEKKQLVVPGEFLGIEEEFVGGKNTFEDGNGNVLSECIGVPEFDHKRREVKVKKISKEVKPLEPGSIAYGKVALVKEQSVLIELFKAEKNNEPRTILNTFASLPVFNVSQGYVKFLSDMFRVGDIVKAGVVTVTNYGIDLNTKDKSFGVVKAFCVKCRKPLHMIGEQLKCPCCGRTEPRKISSDYMLK
ncbi:MAG: exosome complex RNA-binding protein Csl4 [Candidatus Diapherotrites archaeon]